MVKVGIVGASGYTGEELARLVCRHPKAELTVATSRQYCGKSIADLYPNLRGFTDLELTDVETSVLSEKAELVFTAVPHQTAMEIVPLLLQAGCKVIDLSADYRISSPSIYEEWYQAHTSPELLADAVYGLPELKRELVKGSSLVANPGCYPTSIILAMYPLLASGLIDPTTIIADSKSGTSGAGRGANVGTLFCEVTEGFKAYKVGEHRHTPEIEQELSLATGQPITISFTPHLLPISRGILSTIYASVVEGVTEDQINKVYRDQYGNEKFVRFCGNADKVATQFVRGSNFCDIGFKLDQRTGRVVVASVIDNLVKGASGQAIQNMNLMCGFSEDTGLDIIPLFP